MDGVCDGKMTGFPQKSFNEKEKLKKDRITENKI
jgi:hypothetical protein